MAEKISVRKTRRLRTLLAKLHKLSEPPDPKEDYLDQIVMAVLWQDALAARARVAYVNLTEEFVDWNELRVTVTSEVAGILEGCGLPGRKGAILKRILGRAVEDLFSFDFAGLAELPRAKLRKWFVGIEGVPHHVAAYILYHVYGHDRVLVGEDIARVIRRLGLVSEDAAPRDIEPALNVVIPAKEAHLIWNALWEHARTVCAETDFDCRTCPLRKECVTGKKRIAELEAAAKAARKAARKKARKKAREKARIKSKAKTKQKKTAKSKSKSSKKATKKSTKKKTKG